MNKTNDSSYSPIALIIVVLLALFLGQRFFGSLMDMAIALLFWGITGYVAGRLLRGSGYGAGGNILLGLVGGIFGSIVLRLLGLAGLGAIPLVGGIIVGVVGAITFIVLMRLFIDSRFAR